MCVCIVFVVRYFHPQPSFVEVVARGGSFRVVLKTKRKVLKTLPVCTNKVCHILPSRVSKKVLYQKYFILPEYVYRREEVWHLPQILKNEKDIFGFFYS